MSDIDKRLAIAIIESSDGWITFDTKSGYAYNQEYDFPMKKIVKAIKQLMADEFEKMIGEVSKNFKPELIDMAHKEYHPEIAPGFTLGFNLAKQLITDRLKRLEEWKK